MVEAIDEANDFMRWSSCFQDSEVWSAFHCPLRCSGVLDWYSLLSDVCGLLQNLNGKVCGVRVVSLLLRKGGVQLKPQFVPMPDRGKGTIYGTLIALLCEAWNSSSR